LGGVPPCGLSREPVVMSVLLLRLRIGNVG
jgi:hypothetical protein